MTGAAKYIAKDLKDRSAVHRPPAEWDGRRCRSNWQSRGFLVRSKKLLWAELKAEWYPITTVAPGDESETGEVSDVARAAASSRHIVPEGSSAPLLGE